MIKVDVCIQTNAIHTIVIHDHAGYASAGQDLVCAGVSSIAIGMMNALDALVPDTCIFEILSSYIRIQVIQMTSTLQLLLEAFIIQLKTVEETYQNYIHIHEEEVLS